MQDETKNMGRQQRKRVIIAAVLAAVTLLLLCVDWHEMARDAYAQIQHKKRLVWMTDESPWGFDAQRRDSMGFHYELIKAYADSMGLELEVNIVNGRKEQLQVLQKRKAHVLATDVVLTESVQSQFSPCQLPHSVKMCLLQSRVNEPLIVELAQLDGKRLLVPSDEAFYLRIQHLMEELEIDVEVVTQNGLTEEEVLEKVSRGEERYGLCLSRHAKLCERFYPELDYSLIVGFDQPCGWVVNKHDEALHQSLRRFLARYVETPEYRALYRKY